MDPVSKKPRIDENAYVAPGAQVVGDVVLCSGASVWYNAVLRGDIAAIFVGEGSNIQDNCTLHCDHGVPLVVGKNVTVGHNAVLHSCTVGDGSLIGMGSTVLAATIGKGCLIAAGSVVMNKAVIPDGTLYAGAPARFKRNLTPQEQQKLVENAAEYQRLAAEYSVRITDE